MFDKLKEAAGGLVEDAKAKVGDVTGVDADKLMEAAGSVADAGGSLSDAAASLQEGRLPGTPQQ